MSGDELTNALRSAILKLTPEGRKQLLEMLKTKGLIKGEEMNARWERS